MIKLSHVVKEYQLGNETLTVLDDINLTIDNGEYASIIGPSGSGKSTLMHIVGLLDQATRGKVSINNNEISSLNDDQLSKLRNEFVGFVFQQFNLVTKLTVAENILLPTFYSRKKLKYDPKDKANELMERFGIIDKAASYPNKISGGQQQRVAIARSLIMSPQLILADEPTGNLDTKNGKAIMDLLTTLNKQDKITIIIVTHEADIAARTKRKIRIVDGKIV